MQLERGNVWKNFEFELLLQLHGIILNCYIMHMSWSHAQMFLIFLKDNAINRDWHRMKSTRKSLGRGRGEKRQQDGSSGNKKTFVPNRPLPSIAIRETKEGESESRIIPFFFFPFAHPRFFVAFSQCALSPAAQSRPFHFLKRGDASGGTFQRHLVSPGSINRTFSLSLLLLPRYFCPASLNSASTWTPELIDK